MRSFAAVLLVSCCQLSGAYFASMEGGKLSIGLEVSPMVNLDGGPTVSQSQTFYLEIPIRKGVGRASWDETTETFTILGLFLDLEALVLERPVWQRIDGWGGSQMVEHLITFSTYGQRLIWEFEVPFPLQQKWNEAGYYVWKWDYQNTGGEYGYAINTLPASWLDGPILIRVSGDIHVEETGLTFPAVQEFETRKLGLGENVNASVYTEFHPWDRGDGWITRSLQKPYAIAGDPESTHTFEMRFIDTNGSLQSPWINLADPTLRVKFRWMRLLLPENILWAMPYGSALPSEDNTINLPHLGRVSLDFAPWLRSPELDRWIYCPPQDFTGPYWMFVPRD